MSKCGKSFETVCNLEQGHKRLCAFEPTEHLTRLEEMGKALRAIFNLIETGVLVRSTAKDFDMREYLRSAQAVSLALTQAQAALKGKST
jgi:hypothetical protein